MPLRADHPDRPTGVYLAPIDMVEDRMRNRVVGVAALFVIYLFIGSSFITEQAGKDYIVRCRHPRPTPA